MNHTSYTSFFALCCLCILLFPFEGWAGQNPMGTTMCSVVDWFENGSVGAGLTTLGMIIVGVAALMNRITWGVAIISLLDVALISGAGGMVVALGGVDCSTP
jgi:type IV secretory pathway VirB2 component (pilin)